MFLAEEIKKNIEGEIADDPATLEKYSRDASLFKIRPEAVVFPKNSGDVKKLVQYASQRSMVKGQRLSLTARSGGSDMTGGPLNDSLILDFTKHFNKIGEPENGEISAEPGVWYRDFEKKTLKAGLILPSYPASREICAIGGMINNNSGGEKTLKYGKTEKYVTGLKAVLADGEEYEIKPLNKKELDGKMAQKDFEGDIYRRIFDLLDKNYELVKNAKPKVSKNSMGYNIWDIWDRGKGEFDLTKLFTGSQGTLGITTEGTIRLVKVMPESGLLVVFLKNLEDVAKVAGEILPLRPVSFESFDDHTFKLALKFFWSFAKQIGVWGLLHFWPEFLMALTGGIPKMVLLIEFEGENRAEVLKQIVSARENLKKFAVKTRIAETKAKSRKYWLIRRESFNLLRKKVRGLKTAPFVDDVIVRPEKLPEFLPKLYAIMEKYGFLYTVAGHVGDGNFHIIPLMNLADDQERAKIPPAMKEVNELTLRYGGSLSAEHNEGLIRGAYSRQMFGEKVYEIFREIKKIFDPDGIFNPRKKIGAELPYALEHIAK